ncbi:MAG: MFS transporter [Acidobacteriota bacterium]|nr:MFS transporter [Acidobacteriota bacterium]
MSKTILYSLAFIALGLISGSIGPTLPALAAQTHVEMKQISNLFVARALGTMVGSWVIGRVYDKVTGHPVLAASLLASAVAMALLPMSSQLLALVVLSVCIGLASASINVGGNALIVMEHGDRVRPFMSVLHFAFGLGGFLAPMFVSLFANRADGLRLAYWTLALLSVPPILLTLASASPRPRTEHHEEVNAAVPALLLGLLVVYFFLEVGAEASVMGWIFSYSVKQGIATQEAYKINSAFWAAFTAGRLATIWLSMRFAALPLVLFFMGLATLFAIGLLVFPTSATVVWVCALGFGASVAPVFPSMFGFAQNRLHLSGKVTGLFLVGASAGGMFWPRLIGQFFESQGAQVMTWTVVATMLSALTLILMITSRSHQEAQA